MNPLGRFHGHFWEANTLDEAVAYLRTILQRALSEDIGPVDVTTAALAKGDEILSAKVMLRSGGVMCGGFVIRETIEACARFLGTAHVPEINLPVQDSTLLPPNSVIGEIKGNASLVLACERVMLNFLGIMCGVATLTRKFVDAVAGTRCRILDTRKTIPMHRSLQKYAVRCGGGANHRQGLYDMILIKDNHLKLFGMDIPKALKLAAEYRDKHSPELPVEIEVENLRDLETALELSPNIVMLDNMTPVDVCKAVDIRNRINTKVQLEVSGGVTLATVAEYAQAGIERISIGALTHSAPSADVALDVE